MSQKVMQTQAEKMKKGVPDIRPGYTVRVHQKVQEGDKERVQIFEGMVIAVHNGHTMADRSFTVRRIASGIGVEKVFPLHSPSIDKIEVKKVAKVRRAKLNFLRGRSGKSARISERFTTSDEFAIATPVAAPVVEEAAIVTEAEKPAEAPVAETKAA
jgi:large subunit ribosomal protein L19